MIVNTVGDVVLETETGGSVSLISKEIGKNFVAPLHGAAKLGSIFFKSSAQRYNSGFPRSKAQGQFTMSPDQRP